jgi:hypothetical protein
VLYYAAETASLNAINVNQYITLVTFTYSSGTGATLKITTCEQLVQFKYKLPFVVKESG